MKYIGLAYEEEHALNALSNEEWLKLRRETLDYVEELRRSGKLLAAEPLKSVRTATTVRVRSGKITITDHSRKRKRRSADSLFSERTVWTRPSRSLRDGPQRASAASK
jgi:hypothetical protein